MAEYAGWQQRVIEEQAALTEKIVKLKTFLRTGGGAALCGLDRDILETQLEHMQGYADALAIRIARFNA